MRKSMWVLLFFLCLVLVAAVRVEGEPRNVRLRAQVSGDSLYFRAQWNAPQRGRWDTPVEGYEWMLVGATTDSLGATQERIYGSGTTAANDRRVELTVFFDCVNSPTTFVFRVRATGNFSEVAPWGASPPFLMSCNDSPPGPPTVDLDTVPRDTMATEPDSLVLRPVDLVDATWDPVTKRLTVDTAGAVNKICAVAYRDGSSTRWPRGPWVTTIDTTMVVTTSDVVTISNAPPLEDACWYWTAVDSGSAEISLCTTDCSALVAGLLPGWLRWPLFLAGVLVLAWAWGREWRRRRRRRG